MKACPFCAEDIQDQAIVCKHCGRDLPSAKTMQQPVTVEKKGKTVLAAIGGLAVIGLAVSLWTGADTARVAGNFLPALEITLDSDALEIPAGSWNSWSWDVDPKRPVCKVHATVQGVSGGNKDFEAFLMDQDGYTNWKNGTNPRVFYQSGKVSSATVDGVIAGAGPKYYIVISNRFSTFTTKTVEAGGGRVICTAS